MPSPTIASILDELAVLAAAIASNSPTPPNLLKFSVADATTGIATGNYFYALSSNILRVVDNPVGSVACVSLGLLYDLTGLAGNRFIGNASSVVEICGPEDFIQVTRKDPAGMNLYARKSSILCIYDSAIAPAYGNPPSTMLDVDGPAPENVNESISSIVTAMNLTVVDVV